MHDDSTRAGHHRRQRQHTKSISALAAVLLAAFASPALTASPSEQTDTTATIARQAAHEVRIGFTKPGREGIELAARLEENGGLIQRPIFWTVRKDDGEKVFEGEVPTADFLTPPGDYDITVRYGTVTVKRALTLLPAQRIGVTFTLDVGGIRVLPRIEGLGLPQIGARMTVYAESGPEAGRQIALSTVPGEIIRVGAGKYRVETRFMPGNATNSAKVTVKPGIMSAVEIDHVAGIARLSANETSWVIKDNVGETLPPIAGPAEVALKPGTYVAEVTRGGATSFVSFSIEAGKTETVTLAP
jgi:hypothetical protein